MKIKTTHTVVAGTDEMLTIALALHGSLEMAAMNSEDESWRDFAAQMSLTIDMMKVIFHRLGRQDLATAALENAEVVFERALKEREAK